MNTLELLGFTEMDLFIMNCCVAAAGAGSIIDYLIKRENFEILTATPETQLTFNRYFPLLLARVTLGFAAGFVVYLLLTGTITVDKAGFSRLILLSALAGFSAPAVANKYKNKIPSSLSSLISNTPQHTSKPTTPEKEKDENEH
jgi:hypothetical protein